jgi:hypothetical protein
MRKKIKLSIQLLLISVNVGFANGSQLSDVNRFDLSYDYFQKVHEAIMDSSEAFFYSYPVLTDKLENPFVELTHEDQKLGVSAGALPGYEQSDDRFNRFMAILGKAAYSSKYLDAHVLADVYSTENRINSDIMDIQFERFIKKDGEKPITGAFDFRFNLPEAYLTFHVKHLDLSVGKMKMRWGPGYKGTLGMSGTSYSPTYFYNTCLSFGNVLNLSAFLCGYDDESIYENELKYNDSILIVGDGKKVYNYLPRYGAGQRIDLRIGKHFQIGIYELVDFFGSSDLSRFANPLQLYYLGNGSSGTNNANLLGGMDFNIIINKFRIYGEFLNDDITIFENAGNPNKYAFQTGITYYGGKKLLETGIEYTHVAKYVYGHSRVLSRHSIWGESLGWPWGNDQDLFNAHAILNMVRNVNCKIELNYWKKGAGKLTDDWYADKEPNLDHAPYWPQNCRNISTILLGVEYLPFAWSELNCFYELGYGNHSFNNSINMYLKIDLPEKYHFSIK